jgi:hypothetical protein
MKTTPHIRALAIVLFASGITWPALRSRGEVRATASSRTSKSSREAFNTLRLEARGNDSLGADSNGWQDMMPRGSLAGWTRVAIPPDKPLDSTNQWSLDKDHGTIVCEGNHGHEWLRYDREFANFLLHVEWRFEKKEGAKGYNSGVFVRNDHEGRVWHQAQVGTLAFIFGQTLWHGELSPIFDELWKNPPAEVNVLHAIGEWNTYEIRCDGPKIILWANEHQADRFDAPEVPKGYFGLEAEGYHIEFRNIKLKNLP